MIPFTTAVWVCTLTVMLLSPSCDAGSVLTFTASPATVKPNFTREVTMRCQLAENQARTSSSDLDLDHVTQMAVLYNDHDYVAVVTKNEPAQGYVDEGNLRVSGDASGLGFLQLTWSDPSALSMGSYTCLMDGKSKGNQFVSLKKGLRLTSEEPSMVDLLERINQNEKDRQDGERKLLEADKKQITDLEKTIKRQQETIKCMSQRVAFKAETSPGRYSSNKMTLPANQIVVWDRVTLSQGGQGGGYNSVRGDFTSPAAGLYLFHVHAQGATKGDVCLQLENNGVPLVDLFKHGDDHVDDATLTHSIELKKGDVLSVRGTCTSVLWQNPNIQQFNLGRVNYFMGTMVAASGCNA